jgi:hypothetical protein
MWRETDVAAGIDNEQFVREFLAAMGPNLEEFKRNYRERMAEDLGPGQ